MLNSASDYKFVNVTPVADRIHGNILPITNPLNAPAPIYFEDYLFLLEGFYERSNPNLAGNNNITTPPPTIYAANIIATELQVNGHGSQYEAMRIPYIEQSINQYPLYISPNTSIISQPYYIGTNQNTNPTINGVFTNFTNVKVTNTTAYLPKRPWRGSYVMWSEYIRASYYQMNNCSKLWITPAISCFVSSAKQYIYNYDGSVIAEYDYNVNNRVNGYQIINASFNGRKSGDVIPTYKSNFGTFPYAKSALALVWCSAQESSAGNRQCYCIPIQMTISNGEIQVPQQLFENATSLTCAQLGKTLSTIYYAAAGPVDVVIDFEFPARLNGISWNWQPTYT